MSKCAKICTNSLRICTLEMQDAMMRSLPSVLLQLSKISATVYMAIPVLAFLSSEYYITRRHHKILQNLLAVYNYVQKYELYSFLSAKCFSRMFLLIEKIKPS